MPRFSTALVVISLTFLAFLRFRDRFGDPDLRVTVWDIGQGDAILVQFPGGKTAMIDGGGGGVVGEKTWTVADRVLVPELTRLGILRLDWLILTHPDADHAYGFLTLLEQFSVGELRYHQYFQGKPIPLFERLLRNAKSARAMGERETERVGPVEVESIPVETRAKTANDHSLVTRLVYGRCSLLFTGDLQDRGEADLVRKLGGPVTALKVAHHGSKTSTQSWFLHVARPRLALISAGLNNRYGHPHREVLTSLALAGTQVLRTDFHGYIRLRITPTSMTCESAQGGCGRLDC